MERLITNDFLCSRGHSSSAWKRVRTSRRHQQLSLAIPAAATEVAEVQEKFGRAPYLRDMNDDHGHVTQLFSQR